MQPPPGVPAPISGPAACIRSRNIRPSNMKLSKAKAWGLLKNGESSHIVYSTPTLTLPYPTLPYPTQPYPACIRSSNIRSSKLKLGTAQAWRPFLNGEASHIIYPNPTPTPTPTPTPGPTLSHPTVPSRYQV